MKPQLLLAPKIWFTCVPWPFVLILWVYFVSLSPLDLEFSFETWILCIKLSNKHFDRFKF